METKNENMKMTPKDYSALRIKNGADISTWPEVDRARVAAFLKTPDGQKAHAQENSVDAMFANFRRQEAVQLGDASEFLARLAVIPEQYPQALSDNLATTMWPIWNGAAEVFDRFFSPQALFSRVGYASQGLAFSALLFAGIFVGQNYGPNDSGGNGFGDENTGYDLTASLFEGDSGEYDFSE